MKEKTQPLVIIKCLVYNHEPYLRQCLDGFVMQQTNFPFYAVVHDDASTDNSAAIIREYAEKYPDIIHPIYETENQWSKKDGSLSRIMRKALKDAKYIAYCEGDDYWIDPLKLQKQVDFLEANPEYGFCYTDFDMYNPQTDERAIACFESGKVHRSQDFMDHLLRGGYIAPMTWVYRAALLDKLNQKAFTDGSFATALDFYQLTKVKYLNQVTATYQLSANSATRSNDVKKIMRYRKGLLDVQLHYIHKYNVGDANLERSLWEQHYLRLLPMAIEYNFVDFIEEARQYFQKQSMNIDIYIRMLLDRKQALNSHAYKIGKKIIKPFAWAKTLLKK